MNYKFGQKLKFKRQKKTKINSLLKEQFNENVKCNYAQQDHNTQLNAVNADHKMAIAKKK